MGLNMENNKVKTIMFSGGGSGGPVTPLLAIAAQLIKEDSNLNLIFIGTKTGPVKDLVSAFREKEIKFINNILFKVLSSFNKRNFLSEESKINAECFKKIPIISYKLVVKNAIKNNQEIVGQKHLSPRLIESLRKDYNDLFWIYDFPKNFKPFYCKTNQANKGESVVSAELWWRGFKIATTSLSENNPTKLKARIEYLGLEVKNYNFYLETMNCGVFPTFLSTINFERLIAKMLNLKTIKEAILFPRSNRNTTLIP
jgi:aspartyl/asparaginyl-tRNA synthetase